MNILMIEDDAGIVRFVKRGLEAEDYHVDVAINGTEGIKAAMDRTPSLILLDLMLPDINGHEVCQQLRGFGVKAPILMLTAVDEVDQKVKGLRAGADDYLTKPFAFDELLARIEAVLRRSNADADIEELQAGSLYIDMGAKKVVLDGHHIPMTSKEYTLLVYLMKGKDKVLSRLDILKHVWGTDEDPMTNVVDVCVFSVRRKLGEEGAALIQTVRGFGYQFVANSE